MGFKYDIDLGNNETLSTIITYQIELSQIINAETKQQPGKPVEENERKESASTSSNSSSSSSTHPKEGNDQTIEQLSSAFANNLASYVKSTEFKEILDSSRLALTKIEALLSELIEISEPEIEKLFKALPDSQQALFGIEGTIEKKITIQNLDLLF